MKITVKEMAVFSMLGAIMYVSKLLMDFLPNIHLLGTLVIAFTVVYGKKALYPIYVFVLITGMLNGFATWWLPYLYIWTVLWGAVMLVPKRHPLIYMLLGAAHGFLYGILYAPVQALVFGLNFEKTLAWIATGLPWDFTHGVSNFFCALLVVPIVKILYLAEKYSEKL